MMVHANRTIGFDLRRYRCEAPARPRGLASINPTGPSGCVRKTRKKSKSTVVATRAGDAPLRSSRTNRQIPGKAAASDANIVDPHSTVEVAKTRTIQEQIATATTAAERMSEPVASPDALV